METKSKTKTKPITSNEKKIDKPLTIKPVTIKELIAAIGKIALSCYGVAKLQSKHLYELNKKNMNLDDSIEVSYRPDKTYNFRVYISIAPQLKLTEVLSEVQKRIKYEIEMAYKVKIRKIDVYAQNIE